MSSAKWRPFCLSLHVLKANKTRLSLPIAATCGQPTTVRSQVHDVIPMKCKTTSDTFPVKSQPSAP